MRIHPICKFVGLFRVVLVIFVFSRPLSSIYLPDGKLTKPITAAPVPIGSWRFVKSDDVGPIGEVKNWWRCEKCGFQLPTEQAKGHLSFELIILLATLNTVFEPAGRARRPRGTNVTLKLHFAGNRRAY